MKPGAVLLLLLAGCAAAPGEREDRDYRRADAALEAVEEFERRRASCARSGGLLRVTRTSGARQAPRTADLRRATCER